jgi:hydroxypyruvate isomerase
MNNNSVSRRAFVAGAVAVTGSSGLTGSVAMGDELSKIDKPVDKPGKTPNTPFAVNLEMWFGGPFEKRIEQAAELGFPSVEFWPYQSKDIDSMAKVLRDHNMTASQFTAWGFGTELNHPKASADKFIKTIEESCQVADRLPGCDLFCVVVGNNITGLTKDEMHAAAIEKLKQVVPVLDKYKKTIILEPMNPYNHPGHCLYGSADGIKICKAVGSEHVKLNWDFFHMQRYEGNLIDNMRKGRDYIGYLQLADSPDRHEPGTGEVNYTEVFKVIKEIGYKRPVGLECTPMGGDVLRAAQRIYAADTW